MFSGIIADIGNIKQATDRDGGLRLVISTGVLDLGDVQIGDSIAVNGVCLTVIALTNGYPDTEGGLRFPLLPKHANPPRPAAHPAT